MSPYSSIPIRVPTYGTISSPLTNDCKAPSSTVVIFSTNMLERALVVWHWNPALFAESAYKCQRAFLSPGVHQTHELHLRMLHWSCSDIVSNAKRVTDSHSWSFVINHLWWRLRHPPLEFLSSFVEGFDAKTWHALFERIEDTTVDGSFLERHRGLVLGQPLSALRRLLEGGSIAFLREHMSLLTERFGADAWDHLVWHPSVTWVDLEKHHEYVSDTHLETFLSAWDFNGQRQGALVRMRYQGVVIHHLAPFLYPALAQVVFDYADGTDQS